jgi:hypothetical protein
MGAVVKTSFRDVQPERLREAMLAVLQKQTSTMATVPTDPTELLGRLPPPERFVSGAEVSSEEPEGAGEAAAYFQSLLELGYLVASADGLDEREREMLALLIERMTESRVDRERLMLHLQDLDQTSDWLGRSERLIRVAADFEDLIAREEALSFAALVALADGELTPAEIRVLLELGKHFSFSERAVIDAADRVATSIQHELES